MKYLFFLSVIFTCRSYGQSSPLKIKNVTSTNIRCNGQASGRITVVASGGLGGNTYSDNGSTGNFGPSNTFDNLTAGSYIIIVKDQRNHFSDSVIVTLTQPPSKLTVTCSGHISCTGDNGSVTANASGGTSPYRYAWVSSNGAAVGNSASLTGLSSGIYIVTVTD